MRETVMIIDNDVQSRTEIRDVFIQRGYPTWSCAVGHLLLPLFEAIRPDIVLIDLDYFEDALKVMRRWKAHAPRTRFIVKTSAADGKNMQTFLENGADAYLMKPCTLTPLFQLLENGVPPASGSHRLKRAA
jgi:DNA-binding response OmpR family regulator